MGIPRHTEEVIETAGVDCVTFGTEVQETANSGLLDYQRGLLCRNQGEV